MSTIQQLPTYPAVTDQAPVVTRYTAPAAIPLMGFAAAGVSIALMGTAAPGFAVPLMGSAATGVPIPLMGPADSGETALMCPAR